MNKNVSDNIDMSSNLVQWNKISRYSNWMYRSFKKHIGKRVLEIGAGLGRMAEFYIDDCERVIAIDIFEHQINYMKNRFKKYNYFDAVVCDVTKDDTSMLIQEKIDKGLI